MTRVGEEAEAKINIENGNGGTTTLGASGGVVNPAYQGELPHNTSMSNGAHSNSR